MDAYIILGQRHGSESFEQIGTVLSAAAAREAFMPFRVKREDAEFQNVRLCALQEERIERYAKAPKKTQPTKSKL